MKPIFRVLTILGIASLISGLPSITHAQESPPRRTLLDLEAASDLEINQFNQGVFSELNDRNNQPPAYSNYSTVQGAPAYRINNLPSGVGGPDIGNLPEVYLVDLGYLPNRYPFYQQGDRMIQVPLLGF